MNIVMATIVLIVYFSTQALAGDPFQVITPRDYDHFDEVVKHAGEQMEQDRKWRDVEQRLDKLERQQRNDEWLNSFDKPRL